MTTDELQWWASLLRWVGLAVTALGVALTFGSHFVADKLFASQRTDKAQAQVRLKATEEELERTKKKTAELAKQLAPRKLTSEQRERFIQFLKLSPKGAVGLEHVGQLSETLNFTEEIRSLLQAAGFSISSFEMPLGHTIKGVAPWNVGIIVGPGSRRPYAEQLLLAFKEIGIEVVGVDGNGIAQPGQVKVHIGAK